MGIATVSEIVREGCIALWKTLSPAYLKEPTLANAWRHIANKFYDEWSLLHVIGAYDGRHITIDCPHNASSDYFNYKRFPFTNLMAMSDAHYHFFYASTAG